MTDYQEHVLTAIDGQKRTAIRFLKGTGVIPIAWVREAVRIWHGWNAEVHGQDCPGDS